MAAKTAIVRDIPIHYEEIGDGRPIVLLHGFSMEHRFMTHAYEPIFAARAGTRPGDGHGWRRIYVDMPGHGASPAPEWLTSDDQVLDVLMDFVDAVVGGQRVVVVGSSWGGYHARGLADRLADRIDGMLLTVPVVSPGQGRTDVPPHTVLVIRQLRVGRCARAALAGRRPVCGGCGTPPPIAHRAEGGTTARIDRCRSVGGHEGTALEVSRRKSWAGCH